MPRFPRNIRQEAAVRAFVRAGGEQKRSRRGHAVIKMPNGALVSLPGGILKTGLLLDQIKSADMTPEEFLRHL
jgi:hypothetical protein